MGGGWFFSDYRVSPNFLLCWGWVVVEMGLGCDNSGLVEFTAGCYPKGVKDYYSYPI